MIDPALDAFLTHSGLAPAGAARHVSALAGGVSSDIWRVDIEPGPTVCVKRALARLRVAAEWTAPVSRNACEWAWIRFAHGVLPDAVPQPLAHDEAAGLFAMNFLDPATHPVWKQHMLAGQVDPATAAAVGRVVGVLHQASAGRSDLARRFDTGDSFHALRLEPYLLATGLRHPQLQSTLSALSVGTAARRIALVHGDVSPKNILVGPNGPVLLDAECAWYGDPAFDIAFCLNHLLLKRLPRPDRALLLHAAFEAFLEAYFGAAMFENAATLERRAAALLPALMLARVDGKSPVEYLTLEADRERVRAFAVPQVAHPPESLRQIGAAWFG